MAIKTVKYLEQSFDISYEILHSNKTQDIIFLHGWACNKEFMKKTFYKHLENFRHIYIDLPGFGKSSNDYALNTHDYSKIIQNFLSKLNSSFPTIVGHSFGGKVAVLLNPKNLVLLSSAGILEKKPLCIKTQIILAKSFNTLGLNKLTNIFRSNDVNDMSEIMYKTFKNIVNEDFKDIFKNFTNNTLIFWGKNDTATSLESGKTIHSLIKNSIFTSYEGDHFFFCQHIEDISKRIDNGIL